MHCNNHKCVQHLCGGNKDLTVLGWLCSSIWVCLNLLLVAHFGTSATLVPEIWEFFTPPPLTFHFIHNISSSHVPPSYLSHFWHLFYFRKNHLRNFRLGLTRVLFFCLSFGMGQLFPYPVVTVEPMYFKIYHLIEDHIFRDMILEENPVTARGLQHLGWRPRAKNPPQILVREKKSAPLACLWLNNALHDACSDCYYNFSDVLKPSPRLFLPPKKIFKDMKQRKTGDTPLWSRGLFHISFLGRWYHQSCLVEKVLFTVASLVNLSNPNIGENVFPSLSGSSVHNFF